MTTLFGDAISSSVNRRVDLDGKKDAAIMRTCRVRPAVPELCRELPGVMLASVSAAEKAVDTALRRADEFFMGISQVHKTANVLAERFNADQIYYAIAGALALNVHGVQRMTEDVDVLISRKDLKRFKKHWLGRGYTEVRPGGKSIRDESPHPSDEAR